MTITQIETIAITPLSVAEANQLDLYERQIAEGMAGFIATGEALLSIREERLYRSTHTNFADYLAERWPQIGSRRQADRLINAAIVEENLRPIGLSLTSESQARELAQLAPEQQREVMQRATTVAGGKAPTAAQVAQEVKQTKQPPAKPLTAVELVELGSQPLCWHPRPSADKPGLIAMYDGRKPKMPELLKTADEWREVIRQAAASTIMTITMPLDIRRINPIRMTDAIALIPWYDSYDKKRYVIWYLPANMMLGRDANIYRSQAQAEALYEQLAVLDWKDMKGERAFGDRLNQQIQEILGMLPAKESRRDDPEPATGCKHCGYVGDGIMISGRCLSCNCLFRAQKHPSGSKEMREQLVIALEYTWNMPDDLKRARNAEIMGVAEAHGLDISSYPVCVRCGEPEVDSIFINGHCRYCASFLSALDMSVGSPDQIRILKRAQYLGESSPEPTRGKRLVEVHEYVTVHGLNLNQEEADLRAMATRERETLLNHAESVLSGLLEKVTEEKELNLLRCLVYGTWDELGEGEELTETVWQGAKITLESLSHDELRWAIT